MINNVAIDRLLIVKEPYAGYLSLGIKDWEMRAHASNIKGWVGLVPSGSKQIIALLQMDGSLPPIDRQDLLDGVGYQHHWVEFHQYPDLVRWNHPWVVTNAQLLSTPIPVKWLPGPVIWVTHFEIDHEKIEREKITSIRFNTASEQSVYTLPRI